jgi:hypothetical protein
MSQMGQARSFGDDGSMSGLPESGHGWAIYEYTPYSPQNLTTDTARFVVDFKLD